MKNTWGTASLDRIQKCVVSESFWNFYFKCFASSVIFVFEGPFVRAPERRLSHKFNRATIAAALRFT